MKHITRLLILLFVLIQLSCGKEPTIIQPQHPASNHLQVEIKELPGIDTILKLSYVLLSVINEENDEVIKDRTLALTYNGSYKTEKLFLPGGKYRVSSLLIRNNYDSLMYAAPHVNSVRASEIVNPLHK